MSTLETFNAHYFKNQTTTFESVTDDLYTFKSYIGSHEVEIQKGDGAFYVDSTKENAIFVRGPVKIKSEHMAVVIRGFAGPNKTVSLSQRTFLPYVNGCSTRQLIPPERPGDPTIQMLYMPPHSKEQAHHIHSTVRVVYVLKGSGRSVVGMEKEYVTTDLKPGMVCILDRMCPHHFETDAEPLVVLPVHVWSSISGAEYNHPMFNGTFMMNQGE